MSGEVLSWGDERPPPKRGAGTVTGLLATLALVVGGVAVARDQGHLGGTKPTPSPSPSPSASASPAPEEPSISNPPADGPAFRTLLTTAAPDEQVAGVLLPGDVPGFLVRTGSGDGWLAVSALGGVEPRQVLLGWCADSRTFHDAAGDFVYQDDGSATALYDPLQRFAVRSSPDPGILHVGDPLDTYPTVIAPLGPPKTCAPDRLLRPPLPKRSRGLTEGEAGFRTVKGRYVVATESRAFCPAPLRAPAGCANDGWEENSLPQLEPSDLVGRYTYEGDFVVRADPRDGSIRVALLPTARLVRKEFVGTDARLGYLISTSTRGGVLHVRVNALTDTEGKSKDDSPGLPVVTGEDTTGPGIDERSGYRDYPVRADADIFIGPGVTGLGKPRPVKATLDRYIAETKPERVAVWLVLDAAGRVLRMVFLNVPTEVVLE